MFTSMSRANTGLDLPGSVMSPRTLNVNVPVIELAGTPTRIRTVASSVTFREMKALVLLTLTDWGGPSPYTVKSTIRRVQLIRSRFCGRISRRTVASTFPVLFTFTEIVSWPGAGVVPSKWSIAGGGDVAGSKAEGAIVGTSTNGAGTKGRTRDAIARTPRACRGGVSFVGGFRGGGGP